MRRFILLVLVFGIGIAVGITINGSKKRPTNGTPSELTISVPPGPSNGHRPTMTNVRVYRIADALGAADVSSAREDVPPWRIVVKTIDRREYTLYAEPVD